MRSLHTVSRRYRPVGGELPVVVHNGKRGWRRSPGFRALYDLPASALEALAPHLADFAFVLSDLRHMTDGELLAKATPVEGLMLHCLAHYDDPKRLLAGLGRWVRVVRRVETEENAAAALRAATEYICGVSSGRNRELARKFRIIMAEQGEEKIVGTIADVWRDEGRAEERAKGTALTTRALLLRQLTLRFGGVTKATERRISAASLRTLNRWFDRAATASRVAEVFRAR